MDEKGYFVFQPVEYVYDASPRYGYVFGPYEYESTMLAVQDYLNETFVNRPFVGCWGYRDRLTVRCKAFCLDADNLHFWELLDDY